MASQKILNKNIIKEHSIIKLKISDLVFDDTNPNMMTEEQMKGLKKSMQRFGYLIPIVVDMKNKIADGEHRAIIYKELGLKTIPAIKMKLETDADRRELRQVMNKLKGLHALDKDILELRLIEESGKLSELAELLGQNETALVKMLSDNQYVSEEIGIEEQELKDHLHSFTCPKCGYQW